MIIDAHTHTYPETIAKRAIEKLEKNSGTKAHTNGVQSGLMASMKEAGISYSLLLPVATSKKQVDTINEVAAETNAKALETGLLSFGGIHPETENVSEVLNRIKALGLKGIKIHPDYQGTFFNDIRYKRIVEKATELGLYITVHAGVDIGMPDPVHCTPNHVLEVLKDTESDHLILAYGLRVNGVKDKEFIRNRVEETLKGAALWNEVKEKLMEKPLYFDTSFSGDYLQKEGVSGMLTKEAFVDLIHAMGSDRVLFGTDSPWSGQKDAVQWFMETDLTETEKKKILSDNFIRIIGI